MELRAPVVYERHHEVYERPPDVYERPSDLCERPPHEYGLVRAPGEPQLAESEALNNNAAKEYCPYTQPAYTSVIVDAQHYVSQNHYVH